LGEARNCQVLQKSLKRFLNRIFPGQISSRKKKSICKDNVCVPSFLGILNLVDLMLDSDVNGCEHFPHDKMDERCKYNYSIIVFRQVF
jgi:hypothetical protein